MTSSQPPLHAQKLTQEVINAPIHKIFSVQLKPQTNSPTPTANLTFTTTPMHLTPSNTIHGGITSLINSASFLALIPILAEDQAAATIASSFQILSSVPGEGKLYEVEGRVVRKGKTIAFCEGEVTCEGKIIARGTMTKMISVLKKDSKL